jgi:oligopeptide/dipeptide ABC transporter ATP-binding protein
MAVAAAVQPVPLTANVLEVRNLSVRFRTPRGPVLALRDVSIAVPRGSIVGLVGESGSGKSTLAMAVMGLMAGNASIAQGSLRFCDLDLMKLKPAELRSLRGDRLSMVFQDPMTSLNPVRSIGMQMTDIQFRNRDRSMAEKRAVAAEMLRRVGIPDPERQLKRYPHEFSGGMRQRIAIAMGILEKPELLIADEPTTALDVTMEAQIIMLLRELRREFNGSIMFISHNLGLIAELCDHVVVLYAGEVVEQGTVRDIFHRARHPYTQALLECDPARIEEIRRELPTISGDVPNLLRVPPGCVFAPRCPKVFDRCRNEQPGDWTVGADHIARCHLLAAPEALPGGAHG